MVVKFDVRFKSDGREDDRGDEKALCGLFMQSSVREEIELKVKDALADMLPAEIAGNLCIRMW